MKSLIILSFFFLLISENNYAQQANEDDSLISKISDSVIQVAALNYSKIIRDSVVKSVKNRVRWEKMFATATYPLIKNSKMSGAFPVSSVGDKPDPSMKYKLLFNMMIWSADSISLGKINEGLAEIGRIINLHVAAGVPKENLELAIVIHGSALNVYLKNEIYRKKFKTDNPNLDLLKQFTDLKTRLLACGQAELFFNIPAENFLPEVKTAYSAQVVFSTYQLKGYVLYNIQEEK